MVRNSFMYSQVQEYFMYSWTWRLGVLKCMPYQKSQEDQWPIPLHNWLELWFFLGVPLLFLHTWLHHAPWIENALERVCHLVPNDPQWLLSKMGPDQFLRLKQEMVKLKSAQKKKKVCMHGDTCVWFTWVKRFSFIVSKKSWRVVIALFQYSLYCRYLVWITHNRKIK